MQAVAVFSVSTTMASKLRPSTVLTASSYFFCLGLQRSLTRPLTPGKMRLRLETISLILASLLASILIPFGLPLRFCLFDYLEVLLQPPCIGGLNIALFGDLGDTFGILGQLFRRYLNLLVYGHQ